MGDRSPGGERYTLFVFDTNNEPVMLRKEANNKTDRWSQHGLGHLLNPIDSSSGDRDWIGQVWLNMLRRSYHLPTQRLGFGDFPAAGHVAVGTPATMRSFSSFNAGKTYSQQIKPFNFVLTCQVRQLGHPTGVDPEHFHLIAPYDREPARWIKTNWIDQYTGDLYGITTQGHHGTRETARVKTYDEILREYEFHPEAKCADAEGNTCERNSIGLLQRRHIQIDRIRYIGKESNAIEDVEAGLVHSAESVYTEYCDPKRDEWATKIVPVLKKTPLAVLRETGLSSRALINLRMGHSRPRRKSWERIALILRKLSLI